MPFLTNADYTLQIRNELKPLISSNDDNVYTIAELAAEGEITSYLRRRYDVPAIFATTGTDRNAHLVMIMIDLVLYHVFSRITPRNIPEVRELRYDAAIKWLEKVAAGELLPDLPLLKEDNTPITELRTGSALPLVHSY